ncbi:MAG: carboxypeptidase regulatory-like domain-containing protein [Candidatus Riflebacteria bacterium]|nr:carboxypeptidase regulatory-like domain-containing protein [Candidatus Riflebacteria bacterium]
MNYFEYNKQSNIKAAKFILLLAFMSFFISGCQNDEQRTGNNPVGLTLNNNSSLLPGTICGEIKKSENSDILNFKDIKVALIAPHKAMQLGIRCFKSGDPEKSFCDASALLQPGFFDKIVEVNENGTFQIDNLPKIEFTLLAFNQTSGKYTIKTGVRPSSESSSVLISLDNQDGELCGKVLSNEGEEVENALVFLSGAPFFTLTRKDGSFRITNISPGIFRLIAVKPDKMLFFQKEIVIFPEQETKLDNIIITETPFQKGCGKILGRIVENSGMTFPAVIFSKSFPAVTITDFSGKFFFDNIPAGQADLTAEDHRNGISIPLSLSVEAETVSAIKSTFTAGSSVQPVEEENKAALPVENVFSQVEIEIDGLKQDYPLILNLVDRQTLEIVASCTFSGNKSKEIFTFSNLPKGIFQIQPEGSYEISTDLKELDNLEIPAKSVNRINVVLNPWYIDLSGSVNGINQKFPACIRISRDVGGGKFLEYGSQILRENNDSYFFGNLSTGSYLISTDNFYSLPASFAEPFLICPGSSRVININLTTRFPKIDSVSVQSENIIIEGSFPEDSIEIFARNEKEYFQLNHELTGNNFISAKHSLKPGTYTISIACSPSSTKIDLCEFNIPDLVLSLSEFPSQNTYEPISEKRSEITQASNTNSSPDSTSSETSYTSSVFNEPEIIDTGILLQEFHGSSCSNGSCFIAGSSAGTVSIFKIGLNSQPVASITFKNDGLILATYFGKKIYIASSIGNTLRIRRFENSLKESGKIEIKDFDRIESARIFDRDNSFSIIATGYKNDKLLTAFFRISDDKTPVILFKTITELLEPGKDFDFMVNSAGEHFIVQEDGKYFITTDSPEVKTLKSGEFNEKLVFLPRIKSSSDLIFSAFLKNKGLVILSETYKNELPKLNPDFEQIIFDNNNDLWGISDSLSDKPTLTRIISSSGNKQSFELENRIFSRSLTVFPLSFDILTSKLVATCVLNGKIQLVIFETGA